MKMAAIFLALATLVKFVTPTIEKNEWSDLNNELKHRLAPFHYHLGRLNNAEDIAHMRDQISVVLRDFLLEKPELFTAEEMKTSQFIHDKNQTLEAAKRQKKDLKNKAFKVDAT